MTVGRIPVIEGGIQPTIFDAKGDLLTATANDTPARLAVGANGTMLVANSAESTGVKWTTATDQFPWAAYTPTTANLTVGNGTLTARYQQIGKTVNVFVQFVLGSTSAMGSGPNFTLPVTAKDDKFSAVGRITDNGVKDYVAGLPCSSTTAYVQLILASGTYGSYDGSITSTVPFTWGTGDYFTFQFTYEAA
jgi:hypothetical protein